MPLQNLPVEILSIILRFVGNGQLQKQEVCCLIVCKWWYKLAEPILLEDLFLSANQLTRLPEQVHTKFRLFVRRLNIDVHGAGDWPADEGNEFNQILSSLTRHCYHLISFTLRTRSQFDSTQPLAPRHHYLSMWSPARLLDDLRVSKLSGLGIDTCGSEFKNEIHICPQLALKIPHLRSVRLRMHRICLQIFDLKDYDPTSKIESIIINLSLKETDRFSTGFSYHCTNSTRAWELYDDMVHAAEEFAKQMLNPSLKVLRILCHKHPSLEMVARDCITGTRMILDDDDNKWDWNDDGRADPDEEISSQEFLSTDSSSDADNAAGGEGNGDVI